MTKMQGAQTKQLLCDSPKYRDNKHVKPRRDTLWYHATPQGCYVVREYFISGRA